MATHGLRLVVRGRVQGVGFRMFTLGVASELGVRGTSRNCADGSVEVMAVGDAAQLAAFRQRLAKGPPGSRIAAFEEQALDPVPDYETFSIGYDFS